MFSARYYFTLVDSRNRFVISSWQNRPKIEETFEPRAAGVRELLREAGELELLNRAQEFWKAAVQKVAVGRGEILLDDLFKVGAAVGYNWFKPKPEFEKG